MPSATPSPLTPPPAAVAVWLESPAPHLTIRDDQFARLQSLVPRTAFALARTSEAFLELLPEADAAFVWRFKQEWLALAPKLRWIATPAAGRDYFRIDPPPGLRMSYGGFHGPLMAETVAGMMLAVCRGVLPSAVAMRADSPWPRAVARASTTLAGSRAVVVGFGKIGREIGRTLKALGLRLTGVNRRRLDAPGYFDPGDRMRSLAELDGILPETDHLVLCVPSGEDSDGMVDARRLALLPPGAGLVNVGRGNALGVEGEAALAAALRAGQLRYACLDVFAREPLPADSPLWGAPGFYPTPHISALAPEYMDLFIGECLPWLGVGGA